MAVLTSKVSSDGFCHALANVEDKYKWVREIEKCALISSMCCWSETRSSSPAQDDKLWGFLFAYWKTFLGIASVKKDESYYLVEVFRDEKQTRKEAILSFILRINLLSSLKGDVVYWFPICMLNIIANSKSSGSLLIHFPWIHMNPWLAKSSYDKKYMWMMDHNGVR